jgi:peptidoglycan/xylan/chitin deacetylase (PgdA/CDA1 family)
MISAQSYEEDNSLQSSGFHWPEGKRMALSLTFDDGRPSQVTRGVPILDQYGVKATFYVKPSNVLRKLDGWKEAANSGHEIGNHTVRHPCTGNYTFSRRKALEDYTLEVMKNELDSCNRFIEEFLGVTPVSFCYPCYGTYVGRGVDTRSYIPLVAMMFETGRGVTAVHNDPLFCDMHHLASIQMDGLSFEEVKELIESDKYSGRWLILYGHDVSKSAGRSTTMMSTLDSICQYATDPANGIWIDHVHNIASYIKEKRGESPFSLLPVYKEP